MTSVDISTAALATADNLIQLALAEDLEDRGDLTSQATVPPNAAAIVNLVARENGVLSGGVVIERVYAALCALRKVAAETVQVRSCVSDGEAVEPGTTVATVTGPVSLLLTGERVVLNFVIHLSGIASMTAEFVRRADGNRAVILDTRKTLPGFRLLHKYAVRCGGGTNHRIGLFDGMLIKDNHLAARGSHSVADAVAAARSWLTERGLDLPVEVEVDTLEQLRDVLSEKPEIVLLDNMQPSELQHAVTLRNQLSVNTLLEASGGVNLETVGCIAGTGVDRISVGALTHSAPALDFGYDWQW
ncbi:MAG: carboxylating nicotinate-nucleotide diphosphorylase [Fuerstiella sp.]|nr:carboxylating nicotinate-nucleotide diphosphorylase [Fuerstiella sp.]MCP4858645.1 carboxylating nicotinate-nucleotide diphosphorylase [Fuerstiella sp.]